MFLTTDGNEAAKSACHSRSAERVLATMESLGGIFIKWGQHLSSMVYILPEEYTSTLARCQDRCTSKTTLGEIRRLVTQDCNQDLDSLFSEFDPEPIGVASLAQVHRARLRETGQVVAVKLQHPQVEAFCQIDIDTVSWIFDVMQWWFPDFGFHWVSEDMRDSLPQELDFRNEAEHARRLAAQFANDTKTALVVPQIFFAHKRILCMEFMEGARVDDLEYMQRHRIKPSAVSTELMTIYSKMIFLNGYVHCDPHPGNILVRPHQGPLQRGRPAFDIVLLDHGLYRTVPEDLRLNYAHLWTALIEGDEEGIQKYCAGVGGSDHRLFASLLTGREWHTIRDAQLSVPRSALEKERVANKDGMRFLRRIKDIFATLPRVMLLLLKTSDLLRNVDEALRKGTAASPYVTYAIMGQYCAEAVWKETKENIWCQLGRMGLTWQLVKTFVISWWRYKRIELSLWTYLLHAS
ncbi:ABC1 family-domain-containing protein [Syncephalastrum racemosum]|uniref:ABC1 family-domain-containing protein n=1 Tax=Syncephalastrum racemosum TaxID=13706 RepID=A0A1X2HU00_SYNRA|nr:ABC1 family-domain-containing protein [Syncephalastrum racemosum]